MPRRPRHDRRRPTTATIEAPTPTGARDVRVELAGHSVRLAELRARPQRYARWFAQARRDPGHARCRCSRRRRAPGHPRARQHLPLSALASDKRQPPSRMPLLLHRLRPERRRRRSPPRRDHGLRARHPHRGRLRLQHRPHRNATLTRTTAAWARWPSCSAGPARATATVTGLGLLHWLCESARLNTWPPDDGAGADAARIAGDSDGAHRRRPQPRREWAEVHTALVAVLAGLRLGDQPAPALCHVVAPYRPGGPTRPARPGSPEFLRPLEHPEYIRIRGGPRRGQTRQVRHRRLLLGELKDLTATEHGHKLTLRHFPRPVFLTGEQHRHLTRRFPAAFSPRRGPTARRVLLVLVEGSPHGYLRLVDAAAQLGLGDYMPADSSHEVAHGRPAGRRRPGVHQAAALRRRDRSSRTSCSPTPTPQPSSRCAGVTGRADYEARKKLKLRHYVDAGISQDLVGAARSAATYPGACPASSHRRPAPCRRPLSS